MKPESNEVSVESKGGTELMMERLYKELSPSLLEKFQIIPSRVRELKEDKIRILYLHDLPEDPESQHLANGGWKKFNRLVFVSHWQRDMYIVKYNIPFSKTAVIQNAIDPFTNDISKRNNKTIKLIYHTTPHRGLQILVPVFKELVKKHDNIHLDVFSSFKIYGWPDRDKQYEPLFNEIRNDENMTYHGFKPNSEVRKALEQSHIFAYPSIWMETSCIALIEAMAAGLICVHPNFAALPETAANWSFMYNMHENGNLHASTFYGMLDSAIQTIKNDNKTDHILTNLKAQQSYINVHYNWTLRKAQWQSFLSSLEDEKPAPIEEEKMFEYKVG